MKFKKILSIGLAAVSALAFTCTALAANAPTTVTLSVPSTDDHVYEAYQILTGAVVDGKLTNIKWGINAVDYDSTEGASNYASQDDLETLAAAIKNDGTNATDDTINGNDATELKTIEDYVNFDSTPAVASLSKTSSANVTSGYYLIRDKSSVTLTGEDTYTQYIVQVCKNIEISRKAAGEGGTPTVDKKADNANGISSKAGDTITYTIKVTVPDNIKSYKAYKFIVEDTLDNGLTYLTDPTLKYYSDGDTSKAGAAIALTTESTYANITSATAPKLAKSAKTESAKAKFSVNSGDIISNTVTKDTINSASVFVITYTAKVNSDATAGSANPNKNTATLKYNNNPNSSDMTTLNTNSGDTAPVYTYKLTLTEKDTDGNVISGMETTLYEKVDGNWVQIKKASTSTSGVTEFPQLEAGIYKLVTTAKSGYTTHDDIIFTVKETISDAGALSALEIKNEAGTGAFSQEGVTLSANVTTGAITLSVVNYGSVALPITGTTGIVALAGAAAAILGCGLVMRVKSKKEEDEKLAA